MERKQSITSLDMDQIEKFCVHLENSAELNDKPESSTLVEAEVIEKVLEIIISIIELAVFSLLHYQTKTLAFILR